MEARLDAGNTLRPSPCRLPTADWSGGVNLIPATSPDTLGRKEEVIVTISSF
jgi:hypothetical protein